MEASAEVTVHEVQRLLADHRDREALERCQRALACGVSNPAVEILRIRALVALDRIAEAAAAAAELAGSTAADRVLRRLAAEVDDRARAQERALELHAAGQLAPLLAELERTEREQSFQLAGRAVLAQLDENPLALCGRRRAQPLESLRGGTGRSRRRRSTGAGGWGAARDRRHPRRRPAPARRPSRGPGHAQRRQKRYGRSAHLDTALAAVLCDLALKLGDRRLMAEAQRRGRRAYAQDPADDRSRALLNRLDSVARTLDA